MSYPDRDDYITLLFQLLEEFEGLDTLERTERRGAPQVYPDGSLIVFFAIMVLKAVHRFKAQHRWLLTHPDWLPRLKFEKVPSRGDSLSALQTDGTETRSICSIPWGYRHVG